MLGDIALPNSPVGGYALGSGMPSRMAVRDSMWAVIWPAGGEPGYGVEGVLEGGFWSTRIGGIFGLFALEGGVFGHGRAPFGL